MQQHSRELRSKELRRNRREGDGQNSHRRLSKTYHVLGLCSGRRGRAIVLRL